MNNEGVVLFPSEPSSRPKHRAWHPLGRILDSDKLVAVCLVVSIVLRLVCIVLFDVQPVSDYKFYYDVAASIADGRGAVFNGRPTAYWPIGYPAFLASIFAVTGPSVLVAQLLNLALAVGTLFLTYRVTLLLGGSFRAARAAVVLLALWPNQIAYTSLVASETLASFLLVLGVMLLLGRRWRHDLIAGVVFGFACLVKPQTMLLPVVVMVLADLLAWRVWRRSLRHLLLRVGVVYVTLLLVLVPWSVRNWRVFGGPVFIANSGGVNLFIGNHPDATGTYPRPEEEVKLNNALLPFTLGADEYQVDQKARGLAIDYLKRHPGATLLRLPRKFWYLYAKDADGFSWMQEGAPSAQGRYRLLQPLKLVAQLYYVLALIALAWMLSVAVRQRRAHAFLIPACVVGYFTCVYLAYFGISRFHFVMVPWLAICAAMGARAASGAKAEVDTSAPSLGVEPPAVVG
jgi:4-amino-4-deoxy-L-arabinose transferase-like glycosyltransferase